MRFTFSGQCSLGTEVINDGNYGWIINDQNDAQAVDAQRQVVTGFSGSWVLGTVWLLLLASGKIDGQQLRGVLWAGPSGSCGRCALAAWRDGRIQAWTMAWTLMVMR